MATTIIFPNGRNYDPADSRPSANVYLINSTKTKKAQYIHVSLILGQIILSCPLAPLPQQELFFQEHKKRFME